MAYPLSPCEDLGNTDEHWVYRFMSQEANRRGVVNITPSEISHKLTKGASRTMNALSTLVDMDLIERVGQGEGGVWRISEKCPHQQFQKKVPVLICSPPGTEASLSPDRDEDRSPESRRDEWVASAGVGGRGLGEGAGKNPPALTTVYLAKYYFPQQVRLHMPGKLGDHLFGPVLTKITSLKKQGFDGQLVKEMIDLFCTHPEWVQNKAPWRVFVRRSDQILQMVLQRRKNVEPETMRHAGEAYWGRSDTPEEIERKLAPRKVAGL